MLQNHDQVGSDFDGDTCPQHGTELRAEYDFGMHDARVYTFTGCRCAVCCVIDAIQDATYHTDYNSAAGRARLAAKMNAAW